MLNAGERVEQARRGYSLNQVGEIRHLGRGTDWIHTDFGIDLSRNRLEGDASILFGGKKSVERVDLSRNLFEFDLGKVAAFPPNMTSLDLNHNKIYGKIPAGLANLDLQFFNVSYNRLCGEIRHLGRHISFLVCCLDVFSVPGKIKQSFTTKR
ncbi:Polygalacturonase inhibitor [Linum perenne]